MMEEEEGGMTPPTPPEEGPGGPPPQTPPPQAPPPSGKTSMGLDPNLAALLCYVAGWVTGLIFFLAEKENQDVRFHGMQSLITFGGLAIIGVLSSFIPFVGWVIGILVVPVGFVLWILLMIKAYQGGRYKLPVIGDWAEQQISK